MEIKLQQNAASLVLSFISTSSLQPEFILTVWVAIVGWRTFTSLVFESTFFVKYDTASAMTGADSTIASIKNSRENRLTKFNYVL